MARLLAGGIERGDGCRCTPVGRDTVDGTGPIGRKEDDSLPIPCSTPARGCLAQGLDGAACRVDLLELPVRPECDETTVEGPEGGSCPFRSGQRLGGKRIQALNPELPIP